MEREDTAALVARQREFFAGGETRDVCFRMGRLADLRNAVEDHKSDLVSALKEDMGKPAYEAYLADVAVILAEIDHTLESLNSWARPYRVKTPPYLFPASSRVYPEPLGVALVIGPWNYPVDLVISPLIGALAAGNCAVVKPSEVAPRTSQAIAKMLGEVFEESYVAVVEGGAEVTKGLLAERFDYIFYTGGAVVGRIVMEAASRNLTPVTLELGGKSPCIVEPDIHLEHAARRITWGKFFNAGQTCIAPDYLLVNSRLKEKLVDAIQRYIKVFYGTDPRVSPDFARIVSDRHFERISALMGGGRIVEGGQSDAAARYIAPTIIDGVSLEDPIMREEIFGPLLPVIEYDDLGEAIEIVSSRPKPLALYFFSRDREKQKRVLRDTTSGGGCINDTMVYYSNQSLPFGGVGMSGFGKYHGRASFDTFSNMKSIVSRPFFLDIYLRYPPYGNMLKYAQRFLRYIT